MMKQMGVWHRYEFEFRMAFSACRGYNVNFCINFNDDSLKIRNVGQKG